MEDVMDIDTLGERLGITIRSKQLYMQALTPRGAKGEKMPSFERLEFLGDSILGLIIAEYIFSAHPDYSEGKMTIAKSQIVRNEELYVASQRLGLIDFIYLSTREMGALGALMPQLLSCAVEALIAAIFLDQGYEAAREFSLGYVLANTDETKILEHPKNRLQDRLQRLGKMPEYKLLDRGQYGKTRVGVYVGSVLLAEGQGTNQKKAEEDAAIVALQAKAWRQLT